MDWKFQSSGYGGSNSPYNTTATITLSNIAGVNLTLAVNGTKDENTSAIRFSKSGAQYCGWYGSVTVVDELGASIDVTTSVGPKGGDIGSVSIPAGKRIIINGQITGPAKDTSFACGGPSNGAYTWNVTYQTAQDKNNIQYKDSGTITGQYQ
ncbi:MAG: hypothetical protein NT157_03945 [Candidatus Micrarchaeota archaeon]|nr:hypothetical protein [Candidatus Micrarchaeota archaeon]